MLSLHDDRVACGCFVYDGLQVARQAPRQAALQRSGRREKHPGQQGERLVSRGGKHRSDIPRLDHHASLHLHVHRVAEPSAVVQ